MIIMINHNAISMKLRTLSIALVMMIAGLALPAVAATKTTTNPIAESLATTFDGKPMTFGWDARVATSGTVFTITGATGSVNPSLGQSMTTIPLEWNKKKTTLSIYQSKTINLLQVSDFGIVTTDKKVTKYNNKWIDMAGTMPLAQSAGVTTTSAGSAAEFVKTFGPVLRQTSKKAGATTTDYTFEVNKKALATALQKSAASNPSASTALAQQMQNLKSLTGSITVNNSTKYFSTLSLTVTDTKGSVLEFTLRTTNVGVAPVVTQPKAAITMAKFMPIAMPAIMKTMTDVMTQQANAAIANESSIKPTRVAPVSKVTKVNGCSYLPLPTSMLSSQMLDDVDSMGGVSKLYPISDTAPQYKCTSAYQNMTDKNGSTTPTAVVTPRIAYWQGKANHHVDLDDGQWVSDPDGKSGANIDKLTYCRKWYPATVSVRPYVSESILTWEEAGHYNQYARTVVTDECVQ